MKNENIQIVRKVPLWSKPNFYTMFRQVKKSNWDNFFLFSNNFCWKKCRSASGGYLPGVFHPQLNFDHAKLIFINNSEHWYIKIENFIWKSQFFLQMKFLCTGVKFQKCFILLLFQIWWHLDIFSLCILFQKCTLGSKTVNDNKSKFSTHTQLAHMWVENLLLLFCYLLFQK